jgi:hypothetical protein
MQRIFVQATKQYLFSAMLSRYSQPNMTLLHALSMSHVSLPLRYQPCCAGTRTKQALKVPLDSPLFVSAFLGLCAVWARALYGTLEIPLWWPFWSLLHFTLVDVFGTDPSVISFMGVLGYVSRFHVQFCCSLKL